MHPFEINNIPLLRFSSFPDDKLFHFTTTIHGGISKGAYSTFNLGEYCGDSADAVAQNRRSLARLLSVDEILVPYQTHKDKICIIDEEFLSMRDDERKNCLSGVDALITCQRNICIGITTADCVPVLLFDPQNNVLAAVHAGWRSTADSIVQKVVGLMISRFGSNPANLFAGIGPSISVQKFEVGDEVGDVFKGKGFDLVSISCRNEETGKLHIDLKEANKYQLLDVGILPENIEVSRFCTYSDTDKFFSARRQGIHSGRMLTGGVLS